MDNQKNEILKRLSESIVSIGYLQSHIVNDDNKGIENWTDFLVNDVKLLKVLVDDLLGSLD